MAKGLTRKITRKQARSYDRLQPNARGVTALVEVNGPGAYQHRYAQSRQILSNGDKGMYTARQRSAMKKMSPQRRASFKKMIDRTPSVGTMRANRGKKKATRRKKATTKRKSTARRKPASRRRAAPKRAAKKLTKTQFLARQKRLKRSPKQAQAAWKLSRRGVKVTKRRKTRTYGKGKFKALRSRVGSKSRHTYMYRTKKGGTRHIPEYAALGYKSEKDMIRLSSSAKGAAAYVKRKERLDIRRSKAAERAARQIRAGRGMFTPNEGDIITYEEWQKMRPNAAKRKKAAKRRKKGGWTKAKRVRAGKKAAATRRRRLSTRKRKPTTRRKARKKAVSRRKPRYGTKAFYKWIGKKGAAAKKRGKGRKRSTAKRRKRTTSRRAKRMTITMTANRRRSRSRSRSRSRRTYRRNVSASMFVTELKNALKLGALVTVGYVAHRAGTKLLSDQVLSKISAFQSGSLGEYRGIISAALLAAIGVPLTVRVAPKQAVPVAAGMAASLIHGAVMLMLTKMDQQKALPYLSAYPNAEGAAYGSYYAFTPHQQMGQVPMMQAAAGYGQAPMQAAAGMGQPVLAQAAAGMGEYYAYGADGIGEYEEVPVMSTGSIGQVDEGIYPNLHSAEQALTIAEAAAGVGGADVPMMSTVNPTVIADPVQELPGGSRAGVFQGGEGIFG